MGSWRKILYPFSLFYGVGVWVRNLLYDTNVLKSYYFRKPVIVVGNLSVGGTGKTPHVEYISELLIKNHFKVAVLSRGYGRITTVFRYVNENSTPKEVGDEPLQIKRKFPEAIVAVDIDRVHGIEKIMKEHPEVDVFVLDDAFQHRRVRGSLNILLTDYSKLYKQDLLLPAGNLREWPSAANRADMVIVTKIPVVLSPIDEKRIKNELNFPKDIYFSRIDHIGPFPFNKSAEELIKSDLSGYTAILLTGIANPENYFYFLKNIFRYVIHFEFSDHHLFKESDLKKVIKKFNDHYSPKKVIVTTEKDTMRLNDPELKKILNRYPVIYYSTKTVFPENYHQKFDQQILQHVKNFRN